jgi:hypothetical protein
MSPYQRLYRISSYKNMYREIEYILSKSDGVYTKFKLSVEVAYERISVTRC